MKIPKTHPRYLSLTTRETIARGVKNGITSITGLIAHGRGEAFDYLIKEKTTESAKKSINAAACLLINAKHPVISVNGNTAALAAKELVQLSKTIPAKLEINIFHPSKQRELKIKKHLIKNGAKEVLLPQKNSVIKHISSNRKYVNQEGIKKADVVFTPLEDGDRTEALIKNNKKAIVIDLNPFTRNSKKATITIVDNITRTIPILIKKIKYLKNNRKEKNTMKNILKNYDNKKNLKKAIKEINNNLVKE